MSDEMPSRPARQVREALNNLLQQHERTRGKEVGEMFLGADVFVARLHRPQVLEGSWSEVEREISLLDLMDAFVASGEPSSGDGGSPSLLFPGRPTPSSSSTS